jgi:hypothetical protein
MSPGRLRAGVYLALAIACARLFYERCWKWRDCIHEALSSCITPDGQSLISDGQLWGPLAAAALRLALPE